VTDYWFGGTYIATTNIINTDNHPDIISFGYAAQEFFLDSADMSALNLMWAQADAEGISVFVATGDSGSNPGFAAAYQAINGQVGNPGVSANGAATSPHVTAVGGTDLADIYDGTTNKYFAPIPSVVGGSALSYVPEIPWNESCGNGVVAKSLGFDSAVEFCQSIAASDPHAYYLTSMSGSGGPSTVNAKPAWQRQVFNAAKDQSRDIPDVSLFAGSYGQHTYVVTCQDAYPCSAPDFSTNMMLMSSTSVSTAMFAGIQALIDQGLAMRGLAVGQGNAAPTLYALAAQEYGSSSGPAPASLATCNADNGATGTDNCVFHNITRGSISSQCYEDHLQNKRIDFTTSNCYYYFDNTTYWPERVVEPYVGDRYLGLTTTDAAPSAYGVSNKAFGAQPGWSFASGLGSVNATNLLIAWRAFVHAPATMATSP